MFPYLHTVSLSPFNVNALFPSHVYKSPPGYIPFLYLPRGGPSLAAGKGKANDKGKSSHTGFFGISLRDGVPLGGPAGEVVTRPSSGGPRWKVFDGKSGDFIFDGPGEKGRFLEKASRKKKDGKPGEWRWVSLESGGEMATCW